MHSFHYHKCSSGGWVCFSDFQASRERLLGAHYWYELISLYRILSISQCVTVHTNPDCNIKGVSACIELIYDAFIFLGIQLEKARNL